MSERDPFDQLSELPGAGPRSGFVDELERRLVAARTDVGPATPTDHEIEGVVLMTEPDTHAPDRRPWILAAAAAAVVILVIVVFASLGDETTSPVDAVTEGQDDSAPDASPRLPPADASTLTVAETWMQAIADSDEAVFRAIHDENAFVSGSAFVFAKPEGSLGFEAMANEYWGGWEALRAHRDAWGTEVGPGRCESDEDERTASCLSSYPMFGPGSSPTIDFAVDLEVDGGRITRVETMLTFRGVDGTELQPDGFDVEVLETEITPPYAECFEIRWNRADCGPQRGQWWIDLLEAFSPGDLVLPDSN